MHVRVTIIGCGAVVQGLYKQPLQILEKQGAIDIVGIVDKDIVSAETFSRHFTKSAAFDDPLTAIIETNSQLTIVATPATLHAEHAILAMLNRNHVICEKPMAVTKAECQRMNLVSHATGFKLSIGMIRRFYPSLICAKKMIENSTIGEVLSISYREGRQYRWPIVSVESFFAKSCSGILMDIGSHVFDTLTWLFGKPQVVSHFDDCMDNGIEASCITKLKFNDIAVDIHLSWDYELNNALIVKGSKGKIVVSLDNLNAIQAIDNDGKFMPLPDISIPNPLNKKSVIPNKIQDCIYINIAHMIRSIMKDELPVIGGEDGMAVISILEDCRQISKPMDMIWLPAEQNDSFKKLHWSEQRWVK